MSKSFGLVQKTGNPLSRMMFYAAGSLAIAATGFAVQMDVGRPGVLAAALSGLLAAQIIKYATVGTRLTVGEAFQDALIAGVLAALATPGTKVWQAPAAWPEVFTTTCPTAAIACLLYYGLVAYRFVTAGRHPSLAAGCSIPAAPVLFNLLLVLQSSAMVERIGSVLTLGANLSPDGLQRIGKACVLLSPPFTEHSNPYPGRLADYPPGVRENGGQYSHGASWLVDALVRLSEGAGAAGDPGGEARHMAAAVRVWRKISPLAHMGPEVIDRFGLPPHQQPADIYFGYGCEGRGGWCWYTGAAARMLSAAYGILGLKMEKGDLQIPESLFSREGPASGQLFDVQGGGIPWLRRGKWNACRRPAH